MSYIAGDSSATVSTNMSDLYVFDSAEGSSYANQPYAKILTMSGGAAVTYSHLTISSGGTATATSKTNYEDVTIAQGGSMLIGSNVVIHGLTIESGGWAYNNENSPSLYSFTVNAGGQLRLQNGSLYGRDNSLGANVLGHNLTNSSASVDGVLCGVKQLGGAFSYYDIVFSNYTNANGYTYMASGCSILNGSAITAGKGFAFAGSSYLKNAYVSGGRIWTHGAGIAVSLGGAQTYIKQGSWYHCNCDGSTNQDTALYAENGVLYGVTLKNNGNWLRNLTIVDGLTISAPVVSNAGILNINSGGIGNAITVSAGGQTIVRSAGVVNGLTVNTGASKAKHVYVYTGAVVNDLNIYGALASDQYDVLVSSGGVVNRVYQSGGGLWVYQDGRVNDLQVAKAETIFQDAAYGSNVKVSGGYLYVRGQALIENLYMNGGNARFTGANGTIRNATFSGNIGQLRFVPGFTLESAVFYNNTANMSGAVLNSVTASTGATLNVSGGTVNNLLASGGTINLSGGAVAGAVRVEQAAAKLNVSNATVNGLVVNNSAAGVICDLYAGAVVNDLVASGVGNGTTILRAYDNVTMSKITLTSGNIWYYGANIKGYDLTLRNGQFIVQSDGGYLSGATVSAGHLYARATVEDVTQIGGSTLIDRDSGYVSNFMLSGGNLSIGAGGSGSDITIRGGNVSVINGLANKLTVSGGIVSAYADATLNSVTVSPGGRVNANGATLNSVTVFSGGSINTTGGIINNLSAFNPRAGIVGQFTNTVIDNVYASGKGVGTTLLELRGGATMNNIELVTGDIWYRNANNRGSNLVERNGEFIVQSQGGYFSGATVLGGHLYVWSNGLIEGVVQSGGYLHVSTDGEMRGVVISNMADSNVIGQGKLTDFTLLKGIVSGASMAVLSGGVIDGGEVRLRDANGGAKLEDVTILTKSAIVDQVGNLVSNARVSGGILYVQYGASGSDIDVYTGAKLHINQNASGANIRVSGGTLVLNEASTQSGGSTTDVTMYDGEIKVQYGATISDVAVSGGKLTVNAGTVANAVTIGEDGSATVAGTLDVADSAWNVTVNNGGTVNVASGMTVVDIKTNAGAHVDVVRDENRATIAGDKTNIAASTFFYAGSANALGMRVENGVVRNLGADGNYYRLAFGSGITIEDATVNNGWRISALNEAVVSGGLTYGNGGTAVTVMRDNSHVVGMTLSASTNTVSGLLNVWDQATTEDIIVSNGGILRLQSADNKATGTVVYNGGLIDLVQAASIEDTTLKAGAKLVISAAAAGADTGELLTLDFTAGGSSVTINNLGYVSSDTRIAGQGLAIGTTYTIATTGSTDRYVYCDATGLYDNKVQGGTTYTNAFAGKTWNFSTGNSIAVTEFSIGEAKTTAGAITTADTALNTNDRAAKWDATTSYTDSVTLADSTLAGDAWLEIDGTNVSTALYGASGNYAHTVNIEAKSGEIRNLAAGANANGSVAGVKLTLDGADVTGAAYAGGFGNVTGKTETLITDGSFTKDFYAGALANYAKTSTATTVNDIAMTIEGGEFSGNIYGASAVKSSVAGAHAAGDVALTVTGGSTTKGAQACIFAGGYATGSAATATVYTVGNVSTTISGGSWGEAAGGRGVFGGAFASGVKAEADSVAITVSGGTMGNVYGGGWAQKNGTSIVGNVNISITGGTIANVFGGGSHSTSGGATEAGDVTITVSGGDITGAIYARGQLDGDITGAASVIFTGATDFGCDVFGYSYVGGAASDATLSFTAYTGEFSGNLGGFDSIVLDDNTAMTLSTAAADVANGKWEFDLTDRADTLAGTSLLTWDNADFAGDTVKVNFTDATQAAAEWSIATAAFDATTTFDLYIGGSEITSVAYDTAIAEGDWAGWKFTDENGTLKFKQLA